MIKEHAPLHLKPSKPIMSMIRIYLANLLSADHGVESFTRDSLDCLAIYVYQVIVSLLISVKSILSTQGRVVPSVLHVLLACKFKNIRLDSLLSYLIQKEKENERKVAASIINKYDTKRLIIKQNCLFEDDIIDPLHANIFSIPLNYISAQESKHNPLPLRKPICEHVDKPSAFSYLAQEVAIEKQFEGDAVKRQAVIAEFEIRSALTKKQKLTDTCPREKQPQLPKKQNEKPRISFDLCKYL